MKKSKAKKHGKKPLFAPIKVKRRMSGNVRCPDGKGEAYDTRSTAAAA